MAQSAALPNASLFQPGDTNSSRVPSFSEFLLEKTNRRYLLIALIGSVAQFILLKTLYPFPDFISDSYSYIYVAATHMNVGLWPIGYSKFLWLIHQLSHSDLFLLAVQYALLQASLLYFFFSFLYLFQPARNTSNILYTCLLFNPAALYLSNCVLSDALFSSISIIWFTGLLWMLKKPRRYQIVSQALLIGAAFTLRYTAIYYPFITALALLLSKNRAPVKAAGILSPWLLILPFIFFTKAQTKEITGTPQFSVFGGWQLANNALYMYGHIQVQPGELPPATVGLDRYVKQFFHWAPPGYMDLDHFPGTYFIKHADGPLKQYMFHHYNTNNDSTWGVQSWGAVSPLYSEYGTYLIEHHPAAFAQYYLWLNTKNYFSPYLEKFGSYNVGEDSVWELGRYWFHYPTQALSVVYPNLQQLIFFSYPPIFFVLNLFFAFRIIRSFLTGSLKRLDQLLYPSLLLLTAYLIVNFCFSVFATPIVLRYQLIPLLLLFSFSTLLLEKEGNKEVQKVNP